MIVQFDKQRRANTGTTIVETLVSLTLLTTVITVSVPLVVRHGWLMREQRDYRLALDELSNQLERLTTLPRGELPAALAQLRPSEYVAARLPGAELRGELEPAEIGDRLTLRLIWREQQRAEAPVSLAAWIGPRRANNDVSGGPSP